MEKEIVQNKIFEEEVHHSAPGWNRDDEYFMKRFNLLKEFIAKEHRWPVMTGETAHERQMATFRFSHHLRKKA